MEKKHCWVKNLFHGISSYLVISSAIKVFSIVPVLLLFLGNQSFGDAKHFYFERNSQQASTAKQLGKSFLGEVFSQYLALPAFPSVNPSLYPIDGETYTTTENVFLQIRDHFSERDPRTFPQRYWIIEKSSQTSNSPLIFYICGEATCDTGFMRGAVGAYANQFNARVVALEHRYYGKSIPATDLSTENLKYLSTAQALEDIRRLIEFLKAEGKVNGPVISIGGSYSGSLSAYFRQKHPQLVVGALASSAPVMARANFEAYDRHVYQVAGVECAKDLKAISDYFESRLSDPQLSIESRAMFGAERVTDDGDFLYLIADISAAGVQYGMRDQLCQMVGAGKTVETKAAEFVKFAHDLFTSWGVSAYQFSVASAAEINPEFYLTGFGYRAWLYQSCTEYGYFQNAYSDSSQSTRSPRISPEYHAQLCRRLFGLKTPVAETQMNTRYYAPLLSPLTASEIYFTNGSNDPWNLLSIAHENGNGMNEKTPTFMIPGAAHCDDLRMAFPGDSAELRRSRENFVQLVQRWISP